MDDIQRQAIALKGTMPTTLPWWQFYSWYGWIWPFLALSGLFGVAALPQRTIGR